MVAWTGASGQRPVAPPDVPGNASRGTNVYSPRTHAVAGTREAHRRSLGGGVRGDARKEQRIPTLILAHKVATMRTAHPKNHRRRALPKPSRRSSRLQGGPATGGWSSGIGTSSSRYERQDGTAKGPFEMELHVIRLGDVAHRDQRLRAVHRVRDPDQKPEPGAAGLHHSTGGTGDRTCRPRPPAVAATSAIVESNLVGFRRGQVLADRTVELINSLWPEK